MAHLRSGTFERAIGVPVRTLKYDRQSVTPIGHRLRVRNLARPNASALPTVPLAVRPKNRLEPRRGGFLGREHVHELDQGEALSVSFSGCFASHRASPFRCLKYRDSRGGCQLGFIIPLRIGRPSRPSGAARWHPPSWSPSVRKSLRQLRHSKSPYGKQCHEGS